MRIYDDNVRVFDTWGVWSYEGAAAWRKVIEEWFGSLGTEWVRVSFEDVQSTLGEDFAVVTAFGRYAGMSAEGVELRAMQNRFSWMLRRGEDGWKIIHEHTSAPLGFNDLKGILQR